jgi:hypothetical protein
MTNKVIVAYPIWRVNTTLFNDLKEIIKQESSQLVGLGIDAKTKDNLPNSNNADLLRNPSEQLFSYPIVNAEPIEMGDWGSIVRYLNQYGVTSITLDKPKMNHYELEAAKIFGEFEDYSNIEEVLNSLIKGISKSPSDIMKEHLTKVWNTALEMSEGYLERKVDFMGKAVRLYEPDLVILHSAEARLLNKKLSDYRLITL